MNKLNKYICILCHKTFDEIDTNKIFSICKNCEMYKNCIKVPEDKDNTCPQCMGTGKIHFK